MRYIKPIWALPRPSTHRLKTPPRFDEAEVGDAPSMVIRVSFRNRLKGNESGSDIELIKFFEVDTVPSESEVIKKLEQMGCQIVSGTLAINLTITIPESCAAMN